MKKNKNNRLKLNKPKATKNPATTLDGGSQGFQGSTTRITFSYRGENAHRMAMRFSDGKSSAS